MRFRLYGITAEPDTFSARKHVSYAEFSNFVNHLECALYGIHLSSVNPLFPNIFNPQRCMRFRSVVLLFMGCLWLLSPVSAQVRRNPPPAKSQFLCILKLTPAYHPDAARTPEAQATVQAHFERLQAETQKGTVILAGRTQEPNDQTMGLIIFEAANETEARAFAEADPAVKAGIMIATIHPYKVAVSRKSRPYKKSNG